MSGISGAGAVRKSGIVGKFPKGHIIQCQHFSISNVNNISTAQYAPNSTGHTFTTPMLSTSHDVMITGYFGLNQNNTDADSHMNIYIGTSGGGGIGANAGKACTEGAMYYQNTANQRMATGFSFIDTGVTTTTPYYYYYFSPESGSLMSTMHINLTLIEIAA